MIFTVHTQCSFIQEHFYLASFPACHSHVGIDGTRDGPVDGGNAKLIDDNHHKIHHKKKKQMGGKTECTRKQQKMSLM